MKCPICGKEEFIKLVEPPLYNQSDVRPISSVNYYGCVNCGYIVITSSYIKTYYQEQLDKIKELDEQINKLKENIILAKKDSTDFSSKKLLLKNYKEELAMRQKWGEDNRTTRALIECINELETIIAEKIKPGTDKRLLGYDFEIRKLNAVKVELEKSIEFIKI